MLRAPIVSRCNFLSSGNLLLPPGGRASFLENEPMRSVRDPVSRPFPQGDTPPCPYCMGENAAGIMILFA
jgi:hypothetical protein